MSRTVLQVLDKLYDLERRVVNLEQSSGNAELVKEVRRLSDSIEIIASDNPKAEWNPKKKED